MIKTSKSAIIYIIILSAALLGPAIAIPYLDHDARAKWENRTLTERPELKQAITQPKETFSQLDDYVNDHIGGGFQAIRGRRKAYFDYLGQTNDIYIVGDNKGAMFLTSPFQQKDRNSPFQWWDNICVKLQKAGFQKRYLERVAKSKKMITSRGAEVIYTSVPSTPVLIPEQFPKSAPQYLQAECAKVTAENNHIVEMRKQDPDTKFFYPLGVFKEKAQDPYFYPNAAYHWQGESTWVFMEEFAKTYGYKLPSVWPKEPCKVSQVKWDLGKLIGVGDMTTGCDRDLSKLGIVIDEKFNYPLDENPQRKNQKKTSIRVVKMSNPHAPNNKTAIIFSNSFGPAVRQQYAALFKTTYHLRSGIINTPDMKLLLRESDILDVDLAIVAIADFHYPNFLAPLE